MQNRSKKLPWIIATSAVALAVIFSISNVVWAKKSSSSNKVLENKINNINSIDDDGTADQGRGDTFVPTSISPTGNTQTQNILEIEADVFTDITIVKLELNDVKSFYQTKTRDRNTLITEIANQFNVDPTVVSTVLDYELEDRGSREKDLD